jgi:hypothetical protein
MLSAAMMPALISSPLRIVVVPATAPLSTWCSQPTHAARQTRNADGTHKALSKPEK